MASGGEGATTIRRLGPDEQELVARATLGAFNWDGPRFTLEQLQQTPAWARYFTSWPQRGDFGLVAEDEEGAATAATWWRFFTAAAPGEGFVDEAIPELCIWVSEGQRGRGVGSRLLADLIEHARSRGLPGLSLSVEEGNPARALYERLGFVAAGAEFDPGTLILRFPPDRSHQ